MRNKPRNTRMVSPSLRQEHEQKRLDTTEDKLKADREFERQMSRLFSRPEAKPFLRWLRTQSDYGKSKLKATFNTVTKQTEINSEFTVYAAMRETFYIDIRKYVPTHVLKEVEYDE